MILGRGREVFKREREGGRGKKVTRGREVYKREGRGRGKKVTRGREVYKREGRGKREESGKREGSV